MFLNCPRGKIRHKTNKIGMLCRHSNTINSKYEVTYRDDARTIIYILTRTLVCEDTNGLADKAGQCSTSKSPTTTIFPNICIMYLVKFGG